MTKLKSLLARIKLTIFFLVLFSCIHTQAQFSNFTVNSTITILQGTTLNINGNVVLNTNGQFENNGVIDIKEDWENNSLSTGFTPNSQGLVSFSGDTQNIEGTQSSVFYNISFSGTGNKALLINTEISNALILNDRVLNIGSYNLLISNNAFNAISRTSGFINTVSGKLIRNTASVNSYLFPFGDITSNRFRPLQIQPATANAHTFEATLFYNNPDNAGYNTTQFSQPLCSVNNDFYYNIVKANGNDNYKLTLYADAAIEGSFNRLSKWNNTIWNNIPTAASISNFNLVGVEVPNINLGGIYNLADELIQPVISYQGTPNLCNGNSATLQLNQVYSSYLWSNGNTTNTISVNQSGNYLVTVTSGSGCSATSSAFNVNFGTIQAPVISGTNNNIICNNQSLSISVPNNYSQYLWNDGSTSSSISVNQSGTYAVSVTDINGCTASNSVVINDAVVNQPVLSSSLGNNICDGQNTNINVNNTFNAYLWSNGETTSSITVASNGSYNVTITDANGCTASSASPLTISVNSPIVPSIVFNGNDTICNGSTVTLSTSQTFNNYLWSNGETTQNITVLTSGSFNVTTTDANGCSASALSNTDISVVDAQPAQFNTTATQNLCADDSIKVTITNSSSFNNFNWSTGQTVAVISVLGSGDYYITVTDINGCIGVDTLTINRTNINNPIADFSFTINNDEVQFADNATDAVNYLWDFGGLDTSTFENPFYDFNATGTFNVCLTVSNACGSSDTCKIVEIITVPASNIVLTENSIQVYPNPANSIVYIVGNDIENIEVFNSLGQIIKQVAVDNQTANNNLIKIELHNVASGIYTLKLKVENHIVFKKIEIIN